MILYFDESHYFFTPSEALELLCFEKL